ncbi:MAG: FecR domain-containing protein [Deltaproteobacteria bacterium]|nr:FecR domain-containing protein [Deltaproteobacteria bacterium]
MTRKSEIGVDIFDNAMADVFRNGPECGDFGQIEELRRRRMMNHILAAPASRAPYLDDKFKPVPQRRTGWIWLAAAVIVGAIGIALVTRMMIFPSQSALMATSDASWFGEVLTAGNGIEMDGRFVMANAPVPIGKLIRTNTENATLRLPTGIDWAMSANSEGKVISAGENRIDVSVLAGESWFRVDPNRNGPAFAVQTRLGRIHITGTIFVVNATPADVTVTLLKGQVWVQRNTGERDLIKAGHVLHMSSGRQTDLAVDEQARHQQQLSALSWEGRAVAASDDSLVQRDDGAGILTKKDLTGIAASKNRKSNLQRIHREIQACRRSGDWTKAVSLYQQLIRSAPASEAAKVSRVSLGDIYLTKLHRYNDALSQFNRYIRSGHRALLPEAMYGKCRALRSLHNSDGERKCLQSFVQSFPGAIQATDARARMKSL